MIMQGGEEERHHARLAARAYQRAFLELLKEGTAPHDAVRAAQKAAKGADVQATQAAKAALAAEKAAAHAEAAAARIGLPSDARREATKPPDAVAAAPAKGKALPPLSAAKTATATRVLSSKATAAERARLAAAPLTAHQVATELAEHLRAAAAAAQLEAVQRAADAHRAKAVKHAAEASAAARAAAARVYLGHHEPSNWRVGPGQQATAFADGNRGDHARADGSV